MQQKWMRPSGPAAARGGKFRELLRCRQTFPAPAKYSRAFEPSPLKSQLCARLLAPERAGFLCGATRGCVRSHPRLCAGPPAALCGATRGSVQTPACPPGAPSAPVSAEHGISSCPHVTSSLAAASDKDISALEELAAGACLPARRAEERGTRQWGRGGCSASAA